ncbi:hypothetical protein AB0L50_36475, partial [Streptomyces flaveolus]|uniref:hypothetical protein n=1 Tax=Streptomyces flaveolus TaxID=67297 RepID=UPI0034414316
RLDHRPRLISQLMTTHHEQTNDAATLRTRPRGISQRNRPVNEAITGHRTGEASGIRRGSGIEAPFQPRGQAAALSAACPHPLRPTLQADGTGSDAETQ